MTYPEALQYIGSLTNYEKQDRYDYKSLFKLDRMEKLCSLLGDPQEGIRSIHVAGSKGKGSTSAMAHSILKSAGFKAGLYTSPHLESFRERIRIGDALISEERLARLTEKVKAVVESAGGERPSFFEVCTALAYMYFREENCDFAVYEVGLGGRLDATNVIRPLVSVITPISYEHTDKLGGTLAEIAFEKAGIIKEGGICISAPQEEEARVVIEKTCADRRARLFTVGRDIFFEGLGAAGSKEVFSVFGLFGEYPMLEAGLLGYHQVANAATAIAAIEALRFYGITVASEAIRGGIASARWEGRLEVVGRMPFVVLDGAQNRASAKALVESVKRVFKYRRLILVFGASKDKDIAGMLEEILPLADSTVLTRAKVTERALDPAAIKDAVARYGRTASVTNSVEEAIGVAMSMAKPEDLVLVAGSLFIVGEARGLLVRHGKDS